MSAFSVSSSNLANLLRGSALVGGVAYGYTNWYLLKWKVAGLRAKEAKEAAMANR
eukprot:CAMPEP_0114232956 /NCGR_PEP_ID=MMETSP0058-20121206/4895_1 /TAXON_ID=36894 /ORGANISM="Pyramimonas parkeae, CCMP726" /LENGTH=54 /DNA_ID=CAMNT_0001344489 /DNA_START=60 /DNA_END=224 /DNA_ORIENTATION=+